MLGIFQIGSLFPIQGQESDAVFLNDCLLADIKP